MELMKENIKKATNNLSLAGSANLGVLGESFRQGLLLYIIINSYIFFQLKFIFLDF